MQRLSATTYFYNSYNQSRLTHLVLGSGTLWTTGQVGVVNAHYTSLWRTGFDNRGVGGRGSIQLVTPGLTHWLSPAYNFHTAHIGILTIHVPEPRAVLLLVAGAGALVVLRWVSRRSLRRSRLPRELSE